jgi:hypothetical protein
MPWLMPLCTTRLLAAVPSPLDDPLGDADNDRKDGRPECLAHSLAGADD